MKISFCGVDVDLPEQVAMTVLSQLLAGLPQDLVTDALELGLTQDQKEELGESWFNPDRVQ